jgi:hypothetical protein
MMNDDDDVDGDDDDVALSIFISLSMLCFSLLLSFSSGGRHGWAGTAALPPKIWRHQQKMQKNPGSRRFFANPDRTNLPARLVDWSRLAVYLQAPSF